MEFWANNITKTIIAIIVIFVVDVMIEFFLLKHIPNKKKRTKSTIITRNVLICVLLFFLIKIWVDGFIHFLALLGFVAAALTITQKENILNLTGGLIIMWRQTFEEGDFISILNHTGIIKNLGIFYFTIDEILPGTINEKTGKTVKIPNSLISLHPFTVYEFEHFVFIDKAYYFSFESNLAKLEEAINVLASKAREYMDGLHKSLPSDEQRELKKLTLKNKHIPISCKLNVSQGTTSGFKVRVLGHCPLQHEIAFYHLLDESIIELTKNKEIKLKG